MAGIATKIAQTGPNNTRATSIAISLNSAVALPNETGKRLDNTHASIRIAQAPRIGQLNEKLKVHTQPTSKATATATRE
jgi:hypothetical protein